MDIPNIAPPGPGGRIVESMNALNSLRNANEIRKYNQAKAKYAPISLLAQAASQMTYANQMGPQYTAKMLADSGILANMSPEQRVNALKLALGPTQNGNPISNLMSQFQTQQPQESMGKRLVNHLFDKLGLNNSRSDEGTNPMNYMPPTNGTPNSGWQPQTPSMQVPEGDMFGEVDQMVPDNNPPITYNSQSQDVELPPLPLAREPGTNNQDISLEGYANNTGRLKGLVAQGEALGKLRAKDIDNIGQEQIALSNSGVPLDRMIDIIKDPAFQALRSDIPFFQDKQLKALSKIGTPEQQALIGDFMSTAQSLVGQTVNSFKGRAMQKEFDIAEKLKISDNDTIGVAEGKLRALKSLKEIAEAKNGIVLDLMSNHEMDLGKAINKANKTVDVKSIERNVDELLEPRVKLVDGEGNSIYVTKAEAKRLVGGK